jgi:hypothetical protein
MKRFARNLRHRFGLAQRTVSVRTEIPWHWRIFWICILLCAGFGIGYLRYANTSAAQLRDEVQRLSQENTQLHSQSIHVERQQQVTQVAQTDLSKDMAALQEENVQLKEDLEFYKSILEDSAGVAAVKIHSIKITHGSIAGDFNFRILLIQSGKHDKSVQGSLKLQLLGTQNGSPAAIPITESTGDRGSFKINFKYYQPVEGSFTVPANFVPSEVQAKLFQFGSSEPKLTQSATLPQ